MRDTILSTMQKINEDQHKLNELFQRLQFEEVLQTVTLHHEEKDEREAPQEEELQNALDQWSIKNKYPYTLDKEGRLLRNALELWDAADENPYELLEEEEGLYDFFMSVLDAQTLTLEGPMYRGTRRHGKLKVGDILDYSLPKSWTFNFDMGIEF